jgi:hypothetical protein
LFRGGAEIGANGILFDVMQVLGVVQVVLDAMLFEASFPYFEGAFEMEGKSSLDELHGLFKRDVFSGRQEQVDVVGHDDVRVEFETALLTIVLKNAEEKFGVAFGLEEAAAIGGDGGREEGSDFLRGQRHRLSVMEEGPGLKPFLIWPLFVGLKPHASTQEQRQRRKGQAISIVGAI